MFQKLIYRSPRRKKVIWVCNETSNDDRIFMFGHVLWSLLSSARVSPQIRPWPRKVRVIESGGSVPLQTAPVHGSPLGTVRSGATVREAGAARTVVWRGKRWRCVIWASAMTRTRSWCLSTVWGRAWAPVRTTTWPWRCWRITAAFPAATWALTPAADPRASRPSLSWTHRRAGRPSNGFQRPTAAVWDERSRGDAAGKINTKLRCRKRGNSSARNGMQRSWWCTANTADLLASAREPQEYGTSCRETVGNRRGLRHVTLESCEASRQIPAPDCSSAWKVCEK